MTTTTGNRRLLKLAGFLDTLPPSALNMNEWMTIANDSNAMGLCSVTRLTDNQSSALIRLRVNKLHSSRKPSECGFAACAIGWAGTIPSFKRAGFKMTHNLSRGLGFNFHPTYGNEEGFDAVSAFFDITWDQSTMLFGVDSYRSGNPRPSTVAKSIRQFVAKRGVK